MEGVGDWVWLEVGHQAMVASISNSRDSCPSQSCCLVAKCCQSLHQMLKHIPVCIRGDVGSSLGGGMGVGGGLHIPAAALSAGAPCREETRAR